MYKLYQITVKKEIETLLNDKEKHSVFYKTLCFSYTFMKRNQQKVWANSPNA